MTYQFPPDVEKLVREQMAGSECKSEDEVLLDALLVFREFRSREKQLQADVQVGLDQADRGLARPLDANALIDRCTLKLAEQSAPSTDGKRRLDSSRRR